MMKSIIVLRNVLGTAGIILGAYIALKSLPDVRRYLRMSMM